MFIEIREHPTEPFVWKFTDPDTGKTFDTEFTLRQLNDDEEEKIRKAHESTKYVRHQPQTVTNHRAFSDDVVDAVIVAWKGLKYKGTDKDIPCTREAKLQLPEKVKAEIIRVTLGKEDGLDYKS